MAGRSALFPYARLFVALACALLAGLLWAGKALAQAFFVDDSVADGLVLHYKFDERGASNALPTVGPVTAVLTNGATMSAGPIAPLTITDAGVLSLDGVNDAAQIPDNAALNLASNFTVSAWVSRAISGTYDAIYDSGDQANQWWIFIADGSAGKLNRVGFGERGISETYSTQAITDTAYHHIAVTKAGDGSNNLTYYVDGVARGTASVGSVSLPSGDKFVGILREGGSLLAGLSGKIDDFRLYNRALSATEVQLLAQGKSCVTDGLTWDTAFRDLNCALEAAIAGDDLWIGAGTYKPGTNRFVPYQLKNGVDLVGGFTGTAGAKETLLSQRPAFNADAPLTILNGDILGNDPATPFGAAGLYTDNTNTILFAGDGIVATIDSLGVRGGNANFTSGNGDGARGGGLRAQVGGTIVLNQVSFFGNQATSDGGAIFSRSPMVIIAMSAVLNRAGIEGGAAFITSTVTISDSKFLTNSADLFGGALNLRAAATVRKSIFRGNRATTFHGGAIYSIELLSVDGSTFEQNFAGFSGGAIKGDSPSALVTVTDSDFRDNSAGTFGGGAVDTRGPLRLVASDFLNNSAPFQGAVHSGGPVTVLGGFFQGNRALGANCIPACSTGEGGAIASSAPVTVTGATFLNNEAKLKGGAIFAPLGMIVSGSTLRGNRAGTIGDVDNPGFGGAISIGGGSTVFSDSKILSNTATADGGGIHLDVGFLSLIHTDFVGNAGAAGGGLFATAPLDNSSEVKVFVTKSLIERNTATTGSGGGINTSQSAEVFSTAFLSNTAQIDGGGIRTTAPITVTGNQFAANRALTRDGGGLASTLPVFSRPAMVLSDNTFRANQAGRFGGGARANGLSTGDVFLDNSSASEGGALFATGTMTVTRAVFLRNVSLLSGAIVAQGPVGPPPAQSLTVLNSLFAGNSATTGTGADDMRLFDLDVTLLHNTFADAAPGGANIGVLLFGSNLDARNNIWANYALSASTAQSSTAVLNTNVFFNAPVAASSSITNTNPITGDPAFLNPAGFDYHIGVSSAARDTGIDAGVTADFEGDPRPIGPEVDIGFDEATFIAPTAVAGGPYQGNEGAAIALDATASTDDGSITAFAWDCTDNGSFDVSSAIATGSSCTYPDNGAFTLRLRVTDNTGETRDATTSVTIANVTPALTPASGQSAQAGTPKVFAIGSFADPGADAPWQVTLDWGDNSTDTVFNVNAAGALVAQSHTFGAAGNFTVTIGVRDKDNATDGASFAVAVTELPGDVFQYLPTISR